MHRRIVGVILLAGVVVTAVSARQVQNVPGMGTGEVTVKGVVGIATNEFYVTTQHWVFQFDVTTWGWIHIIVGAITVLAGIGLFSGAVWARTVAVAIAAVSILVNFAWLPYYPLWSILVIAFDMFVIWALTAHGRDVLAINRR